MLFAQFRGQVNAPVIFLGLGSAFGLSIVEVVYVAKRVISPIYLGDAFVELVLVAWWVLSMLSIGPSF